MPGCGAKGKQAAWLAVDAKGLLIPEIEIQLGPLKESYEKVCSIRIHFDRDGIHPWVDRMHHC